MRIHYNSLSGTLKTSLSAFIMMLLIIPVPQSAAGQQTVADNTLDLDMYWELQSASNAQISPDGDLVVYTRGWIDPISDSRKSEIWMMNSDGSRK